MGAPCADFTIVPFCDFDQCTGPLYLAPGSHRTERVHEARVLVSRLTPLLNQDRMNY